MKKLCQSPLTTGVQALYAAPANNFNTTVEDIELANTTAGALTCTVYIGPGVAAAGNTIIPGVSIPANSIVQWTGSIGMNAGDIIQAVASGAGITLTASGEITQAT